MLHVLSTRYCFVRYVTLFLDTLLLLLDMLRICRTCYTPVGYVTLLLDMLHVLSTRYCFVRHVTLFLDTVQFCWTHYTFAGEVTIWKRYTFLGHVRLVGRVTFLCGHVILVLGRSHLICS